jgi:hypothetical protein
MPCPTDGHSGELLAEQHLAKPLIQAVLESSAPL